MLDTDRLHIQELVKIEKVACETKLTVIMVDYTLWNRCRERVNKDRELPSTCTEVGTFDANSRDMGISTGQSPISMPAPGPPPRIAPPRPPLIAGPVPLGAARGGIKGYSLK